MTTVGIAALALAFAPELRAQDPSIDRLLSKLPPPEKLVKRPVERALDASDPAMRDPLVKSIGAALSAQNPGRALSFARQLTTRYPRNAAALTLRGMIAIIARQVSDASSSFHEAIAIQPKLSTAHFGLALVEAVQNRFGAAIPHLQRFVQLEPNAGAGWLARRATAVMPSAVGSWIALARAEKAAGNTDGTLRAVQKAADLSPDSAAMLTIIGYSYIDLNRIPQAVPPLTRAAKLAQRDFLVRSQLGYCLESVGQVDAGISHLEAGAKLAPNYGPVWEHLGVAYQKKGRHRDAVKAFEKATKIMPSYRISWQHLAESYRAAGDMAKADRASATARAIPAGGAMPVAQRR